MTNQIAYPNVGDRAQLDADDTPDWLAGGGRLKVGRERIFHTAARLFTERGVDHVTPEDVAAQAGCSRATLYRYVKGKAGILEGVVTAEITAAARRSASARVMAGGRGGVVEAILAAVNAIRSEPELADAVKQSSNGQTRRYLVSPRTINLAIAATGFAPLGDLDAQVAARFVWSLVDFPLDDSAAERQLVEHFVDRISVPKAHPPSVGTVDRDN
jgi:AcrR family transcriptional regulator